MNLSDLGWNQYFSNQFQEFYEKNLIPARVTCVQKSHFTVVGENLDGHAQLSGRFHNPVLGLERPVVGDWVALKRELQQTDATIVEVLSRKSHFSRKVPGERQTVEQVVAANIDTAFLVVGLDLEFNIRRIERYVTLIWDSGANPVIILNKSDQCEDVAKYANEVESIAYGVPIHAISALHADGISVLSPYLTPGTTVVLLGSSGVGKSTLINCLLGEEQQAVGEVHEDTSEGRHTTTHRELFLLPGGGAIIDNPGMREIQLWADESSLQSAFEDVEAFAKACRFRNCQHEAEPGCAVQLALEEGHLDAERFQSYLKQRKELRFLANKQNGRLRIEEKKWKPIHKMIKQMKKHRDKH